MNSSTMLVMAMMVVALMTTLIVSIKESEMEKKQEKMSFECGYNNISPTKMTFSTNFIMIIILFLVFDLEASIMVPMALSSTSTKMMVSIPTTFLSVLTAVLIKEWVQGSMEWTK